MSRWLQGMKPPRGSRINPSHPLAKGLGRAFLFNEGTGSSSWDICLSGDYMKHTPGGSLTWESGGVRTDGSTRDRWESNIALSASHFLNGSKNSLVLVVNIRSWTDYGADTVYLSGTPFLIQYTISTGILFVRRRTSSSYAELRSTANQLSVGHHVIVISLDFLNSFQVYIDGIPCPNDLVSAGSGTLTVETSPIYLGNLANEYSYSGDVTFEAVYAFDRALSASEAALLAANPYCMVGSSLADIGAFEYIVPLAFPPLFARRQNTLLRR